MKHLYVLETKVSPQQRQHLLKQVPKLIWFTGLSGAGKSTLAAQLEAQLCARGFKTYLLDGDNIRLGLNKDLSFSDEDRVENIRRVGEVSKLMLDAGIVVLAAFISPFKIDRKQVKKIIGQENYIEVFADAPIEVCEQRDVKGLYKMARAGEVKNFTGIDSIYERPEKPDITIRTDQINVTESLALLLKWVEPKIRLD